MTSESAIDELLEHLRDGDIQLEDAIEADGVPEALLHQFASDCIERALSRLEKVGKDVDPKSWEAVKVKRDWLVGKLNEDELREAQEEVKTTDTTVAWGVVRPSARNSARNCVRSVIGTATEAVAWEKRNKANYDEREWLVQRFVWLFRLWKEVGEDAPTKLLSEDLPFDPPEAATIKYKIS